MAKTGKTAMFDKKIVHQRRVSCDGGNGSLGHPRIYLEIKHDASEITCPYCSRTFVYVEENYED
jgi:uncharacterized Zn-finger protein